VICCVHNILMVFRKINAGLHAIRREKNYMFIKSVCKDTLGPCPDCHGIPGLLTC